MAAYYVYILTNRINSVLYVGVTNNLERRIDEHRNQQLPGFTSRYKLFKLVYVEEYDHVFDALAREKQIKGWLRAKKIALVQALNPDWENLDRSG